MASQASYTHYTHHPNQYNQSHDIPSSFMIIIGLMPPKRSARDDALLKKKYAEMNQLQARVRELDRDPTAHATPPSRIRTNYVCSDCHHQKTDAQYRVPKSSSSSVLVHSCPKNADGTPVICPALISGNINDCPTKCLAKHERIRIELKAVKVAASAKELVDRVTRRETGGRVVNTPHRFTNQALSDVLQSYGIPTIHHPSARHCTREHVSIRIIGCRTAHLA